MNKNNFSFETVEEVLKSSKQLQNKIRQELSLQSIECPVAADFKNREQLPPVGDNRDNAMLRSYVDSIVKDYLQNKSSLSEKINEVIKTPIEATEVKAKASTKKLTQKSGNGINERDSLLSFHRTSASIGTQVVKKSTTKLTSRVRIPSKRISISNLNESPVNASKNNLESSKLVAKSSYRLPLQRFAESSNKNIDFFKEHPHLELDMVSEQTTLFPRRFYRSTDCPSENGECVNVVEAEVKLPQKTATVVKQDTWNGILMQNKPAHKITPLNKTKEVVLESNLKCLQIPPRPHIEEQDKSYDIISSIPSKAIFTLQKQSERLAKQKKCHFQRFPVLYIRPECHIQKVASISIRSEGVLRATVGDSSTKNVKYLECKHEDKGEDGETILDPEIIPDRLGIDVREKDESNKAKPTKENRFFKALEFIDLHEQSTTNSASSPCTRQSSSSNRSFSSLSSSSSLKKENTSTSVNEIHHSLRPLSKSLSITGIKKDTGEILQRRGEAYVQTENGFKETVSTITSPLHNSAKYPPKSEVTTSVNINDTLNRIARLHKVENSLEDDIIAKIFERIRKDLPDALEVYKNHTISTTTIRPLFPSEEEHNQKQKSHQEHQNQISASNNESNVKLFPNQSEPLLRCVQEKGQAEDNHIQTISQKILIDCYSDSSISIPEAHKEVLLDQSPLLVQTINKIKSSTVHDAMSDVERMKQERNEYPTDTEIKRAVKIFIDSLTLDGCGSEKKTIINDISTKRRFLKFPKSEFINDELNKYTSSDSSINSYSLNRINGMARNVKRTRNTVHWCDISTSTCPSSGGLSSTDLESESDVKNDMQSLSLHTNNTDNMSDGEIKSIGEI